MKRFMRPALALAILALGAAGSVPAGAASAYHMNGQGSIKISGGGLPACAPVVVQGDCAQSANAFSWGDLTVQGLGLLEDRNVAGTYNCKSEGTYLGRGYSSRIKGNTSNFQLTFNFVCSSESGVGPATITGWFSNVTGSASLPYRSVGADHPHPTPVQPGFFSFKGYFDSSGLHPNDVTRATGAPMSCQGGFAPTAFSPQSATRITDAAFIGLCTAAA